MQPIKIGKYEITQPIVQGGMGVGISWDQLSGTVSELGGLGTISVTGAGYYQFPKFIGEKAINDRPLGEINFNQRDAIFEIFKNARKICGDKPLAVNVLYALNGYAQIVQDSIDAGANIIVTGAGLPLELAKIANQNKDKDIAIVPIVSSAKALSILCRRWSKNEDRLPDAVILEGPLSGGHQGFHEEDLFKEEYQLESILPSVVAERDKYGDFPIFVAGGIWTGEDVAKFMEMGAAGVQVGTKFIATEECDVPQQFKQVLIDSKKEDMLVIKSPVGHPARAVKTYMTEDFDRCLEDNPIRCISNCVVPCNHGEGARKISKYCIADRLGDAVLDRYKSGLYFSGYRGYRTEKISTVESVMNELTSKL